MGVLLVQSRRLIINVFASITITIPPVIAVSTSAWLHHWTVNRTSIFMLTAVNTVITTSSEMGVRSLWPLLTGNSEQSFIVTTETGEKVIHRQSLVSILMTLFASLIGGPVYFLSKARYRFSFFLGFGCFNSILSQTLSSLVLGAGFHIAATRLLFDFCYTATVKFSLFEFTRKPLITCKEKITHVGAIRIVQDFLTTVFRVGILSVLGLKG